MVEDGYTDRILEGVLGQLQRQARSAKYFSNPVIWAKDILGVKLWQRQGEVAMSVVDNKNVVCKAGHEVGKSFLAGILICWWLDTRLHLPGSAFVVSTAPSLSQINAIVWTEVRRFKALWDKRHEEYLSKLKNGEDTGNLPDHPSMGYITSDAHWKLKGGIEIGYGRKPPDKKEDTMSGIHARYVLAIGDEAVGLSEGLIGDLGNITSNATSRRFLICNPTNPLSYVGQIFRENTGTWHLETISVLDSPNFHGGGVCECHPDTPFGEGFPTHVLETLVDQSYVDDKIRDYGIKHPEYISRVLGEFAWDMGMTIISVEDMAVALDTEIVIDPEQRPFLGVDISRSENRDMNTIYICYPGWNAETGENGTKRRKVEAFNEKDAMVTARRIHEHALRLGVAEVRYDEDGVGGPVGDRVTELSLDQNGIPRYATVGKRGNGESPDRNRWRNARAKWFWTVGFDMRHGRIDIDVTDKMLQEELLGIEFKLPDTGPQGILVESKKDMKKRGVSSPDYADGFVYSGAEDDEPMYEKGDRVAQSPDAIIQEFNEMFHGAGLPV